MTAPSPIVVALLLAAGYQFSPSGATGVDAGDKDDPDGGAPQPALCDEPDLVLCLTFDDGTAANGVGNGLEADLARDLTSAVGVVGKAGGFSATTAVHFPEDARLDLTALTVEGFVWLDAPPAPGGRSVVLDNDGQYGMVLRQVNPPGPTPERPFVTCHANGEVRAATPTELGRWYHVACVHDGEGLTIYVDGEVAGDANQETPRTDRTNGTAIGQNGDNSPSTVAEPLIGRIDEVRIWSRALSPAEIAAAAGRR